MNCSPPISPLLCLPSYLHAKLPFLYLNIYYILMVGISPNYYYSKKLLNKEDIVRQLSYQQEIFFCEFSK